MGSMRACAGWVAEHGVPALLTTITGAQSFSHIRDLALSHGQGAWQADTYPVAVDAVTVYALRKMLDPDVSRRTRAFAWCVFLLFCGVSLAANLLDAPVHDVTGYFIAVLPSASFLSVTVLAHFTAHRKPAASAAPAEAAPTSVVVPVVFSEPARRRAKNTGTTANRSRVRQQLRELAVQYRAQPGADGPGFVEHAKAWLRSKGHDELAAGTLRNIFYATAS